MIRRGSPLYRKLFDRDQGCVWHGAGCDPVTLVPQHRGGRGIGGDKSRDKERDRLSNLVVLCSELNGLIETDPELASEARKRGIKISKFIDPTTMYLDHARYGVVYLDDAGGWRPQETPF